MKNGKIGIYLNKSEVGENNVYVKRIGKKIKK
jgi:hypothetical protein